MKTIYPMLADSVSEEKLKGLWENPKYVCEEKLDGSRYILQFDSMGFAHLTSRKLSVKNGLPVEKTENLKGYVVKNDIRFADTILDGEILGGDTFGDTVSLMGSSPQKAQEKLKGGFKVRYVIYDVLEFKGQNLEKFPWSYRRGILNAIISMSNNKHWELVRTLPNSEESFHKVVSEGGEGVILKDTESLYEQNTRSRCWIKVKKAETFDAIIIGFNLGTGKYSNTLGNLVLGQYFIDVSGKKELREVATISGMTDEQRHDLWQNKQKYLNTVIEFKAQQKTEARYRHPQFIRFREDKSPEQCIF